LESYHAGALAPEETAEVNSHLSACALCRSASEEIALYRIIRAAPAPRVGPELRQRLNARIAAASHAGDPGQVARGALRDARRSEALRLDYPHRAHARGGWLSGAVAVLVVALLASVLWALPRVQQRGNGIGQHVGAASTTTATVSPVHDSACPASATSVKLPANALISDMALTSPTSGWAVGSIMNDRGVASQGLIMRFNQCRWAPISLDLSGIDLGAISMDSATDGWAIGAHTDRNSPVLLHYSDGIWKQAPLPSDPLIAQSSFETLRMRAPGDGWISAFTPKTPQGQMSPMLLLHLSGGSWVTVSCPLAFIYDIAPVGPKDLWVTGQTADATGGDQPGDYRFAHFHNGQWSVMNQPTGAELSILHAVSSTDIWASGYLPPAKSTSVAHYDGANWRLAPQAIPPGAAVVDTFALGDGEGWAVSQGALATPRTGPAETVIVSVWREMGGQWQALSWPYKDLDGVRVWAPVSDHEFWVIGSYMVTFSVPNGADGSSGGGYNQSVLLHYADGAWTRYP
jgi:hypothetical protein